MALITSGYWQNTVFPSSYWQEDYWAEFGLPPPPPVPSVSFGKYPITRKRKPRLFDDKQFLGLLIQFLEMD